MAGNANSGRRPEALTVLRDAGMAADLASEQLHAAASTFQDHGKALGGLHLQLQELRQMIGAAIEHHLHPTPTAHVVPFTGPERRTTHGRRATDQAVAA